MVSIALKLWLHYTIHDVMWWPCYVIPWFVMIVWMYNVQYKCCFHFRWQSSNGQKTKRASLKTHNDTFFGRLKAQTRGSKINAYIYNMRMTRRLFSINEYGKWFIVFTSRTFNQFKCPEGIKFEYTYMYILALIYSLELFLVKKDDDNVLSLCCINWSLLSGYGCCRAWQ